MGGRANIIVETYPGEFVYLYTHWGGSNVPETLRRAIARRERWEDGSYLCRIIFCELCDDYAGSTGYGISASITDNEYPLLVVRPDKEIELHEFDFNRWTAKGDFKEPVKTWLFTEFESLPSPLTWDLLNP